MITTTQAQIAAYKAIVKRAIVNAYYKDQPLYDGIAVITLVACAVAILFINTGVAG